MRFRIANRVALAIGLLLFLFFMTSAVSYLLTKRIQSSIDSWVTVGEPRENALLDMESLLDKAMENLAAYAQQHDVMARAGVLGAENELMRAANTYVSLRGGEDETKLIEEIGSRLEQLKQVSGEVLRQADAEAAQAGKLAALVEAIGAAVAEDGGSAAGGTRAGESARFQAVTLIHSQSQVIAAQANGYRVLADPRQRAAAEEGAKRVERSVARYLEAETRPEPRAAITRLNQLFADLVAAHSEAMTIVDRKFELLSRARYLHVQLEDLLSRRAYPLIHSASAQAQQNVSGSTFWAILYILVMTGFGVVVGAVTAVALTRGIVHPILQLTEGAEAIGSGILEHRIQIESDDEIGQLAASFNRMAENRQKTEEALRELAHHDALTQLPNRALFQNRLLEAMDNASRTNRMVAVHLVDLDRFKDINDTLGHPTGDQLLQQVAIRLKGCIRKSDLVARLGGDEFAVIQTNLVYQNGISILARRIVDAIATPFVVDGEQVFTGASIGITVYPHDDSQADKLLKNADLALYRAKQEGRGKFQLYDPDMNLELQSRRQLEHDLRSALERDDFFLDFQPQFEIATGHIVGAEALVRWRHPDRGMISPGEFIHVAEQAGMIAQLTHKILRSACSHAKAWQDSGLPALRVSVNLSPSDFRRRDLIPSIIETLDKTGLEPHCLELEITEGTVMSEVETVIETLNKLHNLGVLLAIDDFGTGYSSMVYLKRFSVDRLKIDQAFVRDLARSKDDASITNAIIRLGHSLNLRVIAEGVETNEQLEFLRQHGCDEAQGYALSRPLSDQEFVAFFWRHHGPQQADAASLA